MENLDVKEVLQFLSLVNDLKHLPRKGWEYCGIANPESIAGHMYAMGMMTFLLGNDSKLNRLRCLQLAVVHDLAECIIGDITPRDNVSAETKKTLESDAMRKLTSHLGNDIGDMIYNLYKEYEARESPEARFVKDLDRFDMIFTAANYERRDKTPQKLQEFFDSTSGKFEDPFIQKLVAEVLRNR